MDDLPPAPAAPPAKVTTSLDRYKTGKIYRLMCSDGHYYIGSTITTLNYRLNNHKQSAKKEVNRPVYIYINLIGWNNVEIELIEKYSCNSKEELLKKEDEYILKGKGDKLCLNFMRAYVTPEETAKRYKEYYEIHKEKIIEQHKKYIAENREKILTYKKEYREKNADEIAAYNKKYATEHAEEVKEARKTHYKDNKDATLAINRLYVESHKEAVEEYKKKWAKEKRDKLAPIKKAARDEKTAARIAHDNTIVTCTCGGTYQNYRKSRHLDSKKHNTFLHRIE
jgi:hypothetical protein